MIKKDAYIDSTKKYRYLLTRKWDTKKPDVTFIMLNPSTADAFEDDPTIINCCKLSKEWGLGGIEVINLFAYRSSKPDELKKALDPIGPENNEHIIKAIKSSSLTIAAWGNHGTFLNRDKEVIDLVNNYCDLYCLLVNKTGCPTHPKNLSVDIKPVKFKPIF